MQLGQLQVVVLCDDQPLEEFRLEQQDAHTITCFIPSEAGKAFKILTTNSSGTQPVVGKLKLDGLKVRTFRSVPSSVHVADCVYLSQSVRRPFLFSQTLTAHLDDEDYVRPEHDLLDRIGSIEVDFFRCELGPTLPWFSRGVKDISLGQLPVGYNAHQVLLGAQQYVQNKRVSGARATLLDPKDWPYARFIFRYQSKETLQAHGIIPRSLNIPLPRAAIAPSREPRRHTLRPTPSSESESKRHPHQGGPTIGSGTDAIRAIENEFVRAMANGRIAQHRRRRSESIQ